MALLSLGELVRCEFGEFKVEEFVAEGRTCEVYACQAAWKTGPRQVALKVFKPGPSCEGGMIRERELLRRIGSGSNFIVRLFCYLYHDGRHCLVEELLTPLPHVLAGYPTGRMHSWDVRQLARDICSGLKELHSSGFVHADLKPSNIGWSAFSAGFRLTDFGISFHLSEGDQLHAVQTWGYIAPETAAWNTKQSPGTDGGPNNRRRRVSWLHPDSLMSFGVHSVGAVGLNGKEACPLSTKIDLWSVGCVLYQVCEAGNADLIEPLVTHGADVEARARRWFDRTPLQLASQSLNAPCARVLLNLGANVDAVDEHDCTALHLAVSMASETNGQRAVPTVAILLAFGANVEKRARVHFSSDSAENVLQIATRRNCAPLVDFLTLWLETKRRAAEAATELGTKKFYRSSEFADVTFLLTDAAELRSSAREKARNRGKSEKGVKTKVPSHKILLASESPVFHAMFHHNFEEKKTNSVRYCELEKDTLDQLLAYIYKRTIEDDPERLVTLLEVADKLQMPTLKWDCEVLLLRYVDAEDAADALIVADRFGAKNLSKVAEILLLPSPEETTAERPPTETGAHTERVTTPVARNAQDLEDMIRRHYDEEDDSHAAAVVVDEAESSARAASRNSAVHSETDPF